MKKLQKFYDEVSVQPCDDGFAVLLDSKQLKSPLKNQLILPTQKLAEMIANEWQSQEKYIDIEQMTATRMAFGAIDISAKEKASLQSDIISYAGNDMLFYFTDTDDTLLAQQQHNWQPLIDDFAKKYNVKLKTTAGIMPIEQGEETINAISKIVEDYSVWQLIPMGVLAAATGSFVISELLRTEKISLPTAIATTFLDTNYQVEKWGEDEEQKQQQKTINE